MNYIIIIYLIEITNINKKLNLLFLFQNNKLKIFYLNYSNIKFEMKKPDISIPEKKEENEKKETEKFTIAEIRKYYAETTAKLKEIDDMLEKLEAESKDKSEKEKKEGLEAITSKIKLYREEFYNVMEFLPGYDKLQYSKNYDEELEKVNNLKNKLFPKKKFAFSKANKKQNDHLKEKKDEVETKEQKKEIKDISEEDLVIKDLNNISKKYEIEEIKGKNNILIENIKNCNIFLLKDFKACYINKCENCNIYLGCICGGTHITNCINSNIYSITHQLRIHETRKSNFYVMINSNPIIEHSCENIFHPLKIKYEGYENNLKISGLDEKNNKWNQVQDFQWLKKDKSPNFEIDDTNELIQI